MEKQMLRASLEELEKRGHLMVCNAAVDPKFEMGAVLKYFKNEKPILFKKVKGSKIPVVGGLFGNRSIYYEMLDLTREERIGRIANAIANPKPTKLLKNGPVMENIITKNINLPSMLPIPTFHEKDSSSFITAGLMVVKDPENGKRYISVRRFQINGGNRMSALIASPLLTRQFEELEKLNKPLEVAIVLGYDYSLLLASQVSSETYGIDKYEIDSALRGEPLGLVKCHSVDLEVPAHAEYVFEGIMPPNKREPEGPFGELMGYYGPKGSHPIIEVKTVMHRNSPIFQTAFPCREEHLSNGLIREVEMFSDIKRLVDVKDVNVTVAGGCRFHAVVSIHKKFEGDGKSAVIGALSSSKDVKHVVVVDDDMDIFDKDEVELALATRVQASRDVTIIPGALGSGLDPSHHIQGVTDKMGIDATKPLGEEGARFHRAIIPQFEKVDIDRYFPNLSL
ncbi:2,5-furandicarboxylate decarboxylase 1 [Anaerosolibacter carboniphilus]|uniref:2,5-furandicarboxylate decarboxylase 1 n=1 Tax=Anaerosolibacter carboniphilus TaxID=1417629 RepID=A0A841KYC5_9FIRM|nr:UbiD family decarboxylase [Anaerosolibacter carboniphilus]MBB6215149.1 2,5-furandicarboxylate decarboxylase 1 [Anaerosolibacter carboniphilus]